MKYAIKEGIPEPIGYLYLRERREDGVTLRMKLSSGSDYVLLRFDPDRIIAYGGLKDSGLPVNSDGKLVIS